MTITYNKEQDLYYKDGECLPRVTDILSQTGFSNVDVNDEAVIRAGHFGTAVHRLTDLWDLGTLNPKSLEDTEEHENSKMAPYLEAWKSCVRNFGLRFSSSELRLHNGVFQGKLDRVAVVFEKETIIDIKTSVQMAISASLQSAGYEILFNFQRSNNKFLQEHWKHRKTKHYPRMPRLGILLKPDATYRAHYFEDPLDKNIFLSALACYQWQRNHKLLKEG